MFLSSFVHKAAVPSQEIQPSNMMSAPMHGAHHSSGKVPAELLDKLANAEELGTEFEEDVFAGWQNCGSSVEEARAKGCFFDVMLHSWVSAECADKELMDEYLAKIPYHWYRDWKTKAHPVLEITRNRLTPSPLVQICAWAMWKWCRSIAAEPLQAIWRRPLVRARMPRHCGRRPSDRGRRKWVESIGACCISCCMKDRDMTVDPPL